MEPNFHLIPIWLDIQEDDFENPEWKPLAFGELTGITWPLDELPDKILELLNDLDLREPKCFLDQKVLNFTTLLKGIDRRDLERIHDRLRTDFPFQETECPHVRPWPKVKKDPCDAEQQVAQLMLGTRGIEMFADFVDLVTDPCTRRTERFNEECQRDVLAMLQPCWVDPHAAHMISRFIQHDRKKERVFAVNHYKQAMFIVNSYILKNWSKIGQPNWKIIDISSKQAESRDLIKEIRDIARTRLFESWYELPDDDEDLDEEIKNTVSRRLEQKQPTIVVLRYKTRLVAQQAKKDVALIKKRFPDMTLFLLVAEDWSESAGIPVLTPRVSPEQVGKAAKIYNDAHSKIIKDNRR